MVLVRRVWYPTLLPAWLSHSCDRCIYFVRLRSPRAHAAAHPTPTPAPAGSAPVVAGDAGGLVVGACFVYKGVTLTGDSIL